LSTLQISLAVIGGLVLAIVVAHSAWSNRKNLPMQPTPDSLPPAVEPHGDGVLADEGEAQADRVEPGFLDADSSLDVLTALTAPEKRPRLDALIDVIAPIAIDAVVSGEAALAAMPGTRRAGSKPFAIEGLSLASGAWETPAAGQRYSAFQAGVQLANRTGALNQIEFSEFVVKTQAFADAIDGQPEFPDMMDEVARARELDHFAGAHDAQLGFTLRARHAAWSPGYVQQNAAKLGFVAGAIPGRMVLPASQSGPHAPPVLGLSFDSQAAMADEPEQTALRELTLSLDVPQVLRDERPFVRLCEAAIAMASGMDGMIIDDQGQPIRPEAMEAIHADLEQLYDTLEARDMPAGSALGRRLFS
jgi:hypothetical protein